MSSFWRLENTLSPSLAACESSFLMCALMMCMIFIELLGGGGGVCFQFRPVVDEGEVGLGAFLAQGCVYGLYVCGEGDFALFCECFEGSELAGEECSESCLFSVEVVVPCWVGVFCGAGF